MDLLVPGGQVAVLLCIANAQGVLRDKPSADGTFLRMLDGADGAGAERLIQRDGQLQRDLPPHVAGDGVFGGHDGVVRKMVGVHCKPRNPGLLQRSRLRYRNVARKDEPVAEKSKHFHRQGRERRGALKVAHLSCWMPSRRTALHYFPGKAVLLGLFRRIGTGEML